MKKTLSIFLWLMMISGVITQAFALNDDTVNDMVNDTAEYVYKTVSEPQVGSIGGEWAVLGLARSGVEIPGEYYENYYKTVEEYVKAHDGVLHKRKYTEYSRLILALTSIGKDPANVAGYNLLTPLGDYEKTIWQGLNGPVWALIALDSGNYNMPQNPDAKVQATREMYINRILECQLSDGGWSLFGGTSAASSDDEVSDPDITGMVLQALAKYQDDEKVKEATEKALLCMSLKQDENGGFSSWGTENSESCIQMIVALCELNIPLDDTRFVKNGNTLLDNLITYYAKGNGFKHTHTGDGSDLMATEQGFYGIVAVKRLNEAKNSLYRMSDAITVSEVEQTETGTGLPLKNADVKKMDIIYPGKTFADISIHENQPAIEALSARNIINGKSDDVFEPDSTMTRAEFATIIVKGLGLDIKGGAEFTDVSENDWFFDFVNTAYAYCIVNGVSETEFNPSGMITREEAAVMIGRAAKLCGMNTDTDTFEARDILAGFSDYVKASDWAISSLAFCVNEGILSGEVLKIEPKEAVTRAEIAQMLYNMLSLAELI